MSPERRPTAEEKAIAHNLERVAVADYLSGRTTLEEFNFLTDRLYPYTKLDLREFANALDAEKFRAKKEEIFERIATLRRAITGLFHRGSQAS